MRKYLAILISVLMMVSASNTYAKKINESWGIEISPDFTMIYDSNVFKYSSDLIDDFVKGKDPLRFEKVETYDDLILSQYTVVYISKKYSGANRTRLRLSLKQNNYVMNKQKSYITFSAHLRQYWREGHLQVGYFLIPNYHIRHIYDTDTRRFEPCEYNEQLYSFKIMYPFWKTDFSFYYKFKKDDYNNYFNEYDLEIDAFQFNIEKRVSRRWWVEIFYEYENAIARAYDEPNESARYSDDSDISYEEHILGCEIDWYPRQKIFSMPIAVEVRAEHHNRDYTTEKTPEEDAYHAGRDDKILDLELNVNFDLSRRWDFELGYNFEKRVVSSDYKEEINEIKDYTKNRVSLSAKFNY